MIGFFSLGLSLSYLETGVYSSELFTYTEPTGATGRYIFAICGFLVTYFFVFNFIVNEKWIKIQEKIINKRNDELFYKIISIIGLGIAILYFSYIPRETVESRNLYLIEHPDPVRNLIMKYLPFIGLYLGLAAGFSKRKFTKITTYLSVVVIVLSLYLFGHKASAFISFLSIFAIPYLVISILYLNKHSFCKTFFTKKILFAFITLIAFIFFGIMRYVNIAQIELFDYLKDRLLCFQGGIWWTTDYQIFYTKNDVWLDNFIQFFLTTDYTNNISLIYLMEKAIGEQLTNKIVFLHCGIYSGGFPASFYIFGKNGPIIFSLITGIISAIACGCLIKKIIRRQYIFLIFYFYLYLYVITISTSGEFVQIFSIKFAFYLFLVILAEYVRYKYASIRNRSSGQIQ